MGANDDGMKPPFEPINNDNNSALTAAELAALEAAKNNPPADNEPTAEELEAKRLAEEAAALEASKTANTDTADTIIFEIDGKDITYKLNDKGDAVDETGTVFKTKAEIEELTNPANSTDIISVESIEKISGINVFDDKGEKVSFDGTPEGLAKREIAIANQYHTEGFNKAIDELFTTHPEVERLIAHKQLYGNLDNFAKDIKFETITLDKDNKEQHKQIIVESEVARGRSVASATKIADMYIADGSSYKEAEEAVNFLKTKKEQESRVIEEQRAEAIQKETQKVEEFYGVHFDNKLNKIVPLNIENSIYNKIVKKGEIGALKLPETGITIMDNGKPVKLTRADIFNYIAIVDPELGVTKARAREYEYMQDRDNYILHNLRILLGKDLNDLIGGNSKNNVKPTRVKIPQSTNTSTNNGSQKVKINFGE